MADVRNFTQWDNNIIKVEQIDGNSPGLNSIYDIYVKAFAGRSSKLRYTTVEFDQYHNILIKGKNSLFTSIDRVTIVPTETGCDMTYEAVLTVNGVFAHELGDATCVSSNRRGGC